MECQRAERCARGNSRDPGELLADYATTRRKLNALLLKLVVVDTLKTTRDGWLDVFRHRHRERTNAATVAPTTPDQRRERFEDLVKGVSVITVFRLRSRVTRSTTRKATRLPLYTFISTDCLKPTQRRARFANARESWNVNRPIGLAP